MTARICVITAGHLATCPRMLRAADTLAGAGYRVRVVSTRHLDWAAAADTHVRQSRALCWEWAVVDYDRLRAPLTYLWSGLRLRCARAVAGSLGPSRCPVRVASRAYGRVHSELVRAALSRPADLFYGGTAGALAAAAAAGQQARVPYALDLEDFHSGEQEDVGPARLTNGLAERVERRVLHAAIFLTAASEAIASAYTAKYGVRPVTINNTLTLPVERPDLTPSPGTGLRLYWFGQTIGPGRGLEDAIRAMGVADVAGALHLRGRAIPGYLESLHRLGAQTAPRLEIVHHEPAPPDSMVDAARAYDVGLAVEPGFSLNNRLALSNKALTYIVAGLAVAITDTPGQRVLAEDLGEGALCFAPGDVGALAAGLRRWADDKALLARAKAATWAAARRRWHWEHRQERGTLLDAVAAAVAGDARCA